MGPITGFKSVQNRKVFALVGVRNPFASLVQSVAQSLYCLSFADPEKNSISNHFNMVHTLPKNGRQQMAARLDTERRILEDQELDG
jgi:hypothetical protein